MFENLKAEMARKDLTGRVVAAAIEITEKSFSNKMLGKSEFTRVEMFKIKRLFIKLFSKEFTLDYLFETKGDAQKIA